MLVMKIKFRLYNLGHRAKSGGEVEMEIFLTDQACHHTQAAVTEQGSMVAKQDWERWAMNMQDIPLDE